MNTLQRIASRATDKTLGFLVAGGHAVIAHGHPRNTFDLDLIIRRDDRASWIALAADLGYSLYHEGPTFVQFNPASAELLPLDLMLVNQATFDKLLDEAVPTCTGDGQSKTVSLRHLLALKCHAIKYGHPGRVEKDVDDVIRLVSINRIDVRSRDIRELFLKHGPKELYEKIKRISRTG